MYLLIDKNSFLKT